MSQLARVLLVGTSLAPILVTWTFADWRTLGFFVPSHAVALGLGVALVLLALVIISRCRAKITPLTFDAASLKTADTEILGFIAAYLLPLVTTPVGDFDLVLLGFVGLVIGLVVWATNSFSVNPLLSAFGYHFYEVENRDGVTFLFISRRDLLKTADVQSARQLSRYVLLDGDD